MPKLNGKLIKYVINPFDKKRLATFMKPKRAFLPLYQIKRIYRTRPALPRHCISFRAPVSLNKIQIRNYFEELYGANIYNINTAIYRGKVVGLPSNPNKLVKRPDYKKIVLMLNETKGQRFPHRPYFWFKQRNFDNALKQKAQRVARSGKLIKTKDIVNKVWKASETENMNR